MNISQGLKRKEAMRWLSTYRAGEPYWWDDPVLLEDFRREVYPEVTLPEDKQKYYHHWLLEALRAALLRGYVAAVPRPDWADDDKLGSWYVGTGKREEDTPLMEALLAVQRVRSCYTSPAAARGFPSAIPGYSASVATGTLDLAMEQLRQVIGGNGEGSSANAPAERVAGPVELSADELEALSLVRFNHEGARCVCYHPIDMPSVTHGPNTYCHCGSFIASATLCERCWPVFAAWRKVTGRG